MLRKHWEDGGDLVLPYRVSARERGSRETETETERERQGETERDIHRDR